MAAKKKAGAEGDEAPKKSGKKKIIVGVLCLGLAGGGYFIGGQSAGQPAVADESTTTTTTIQKRGCSTTSTEEAPLHVVDLPAMSINLTDGHYLRIGLSLALCDDVVVAAAGAEGEAAGEAFLTAPARDIAVSILSGRTMDELASDAGRAKVKTELIDAVVEAYPAEVYDVYFVEFVMQ